MNHCELSDYKKGRQAWEKVELVILPGTDPRLLEEMTLNATARYMENSLRDLVLKATHISDCSCSFIGSDEQLLDESVVRTCEDVYSNSDDGEEAGD